MEPLPTRKLGQRLKELRQALGLTQDQVATRLGVDRTTVLGWEKGKNHPRGKLPQLAALYGTTTDALYGLAPIEYPPPDYLPVRTIPLLGTIRAGLPLYAEENRIGEVTTAAAGADFALVVKGDSMIGAGIVEGDVAICRRITTCSEARPGQIVVALVNGGDATLKRLVREEDHWVLRAENPAYKDIPCDEETDIQAVVLKIERNVEGKTSGAEPMSMTPDAEWRRILDQLTKTMQIQAEASLEQARANHRQAAAHEEQAKAVVEASRAANTAIRAFVDRPEQALPARKEGATLGDFREPAGM